MIALLLGTCLGAWAATPANAPALERLRTWAAAQPAPEPSPAPAEGYRFAGPLFGALAELAAAHPDRVEVEPIGRSVRGAPVWAFHVRRPQTEPTRKVLVFGGIHALEWIAAEVAADLLTELITYPPPDVAVTVIPLLNPDGRARVEADLLRGANVYRRGNASNVDLNRDFAVNRDARSVWGRWLPGLHSTSPGPLSQPESQALDALVARQDYDRAASLHAFGGYLYYPWAGRFARPEAWAEHLALGRAMERAMGAHAYRPRQLARWGFFFRAHGAELDHLHGQYGVTSFLVELTRSGFDPARPAASRRTYFRWYNPRGVERHRRKGLAALRALVRAPSPSASASR